MSKMPPVLAVSGFKNSGKTTLIARVLPLLADRGLKVAVIKRDGHRFEADVQDTDTRRFLQAGARGTAVFDDEKYMLVKRESISEDRLFDAFSDADLILLEGFKASSWSKIEVLRGDSEPVCDPATVIAFALPEGVGAPQGARAPAISRDDCAAFADLICAYARGAYKED
ncbi:MAG: molybdopterin-guanine dinucleotide biosynthesis protein B [Clostridiales Family XIII bacterium]|jgi:molybdopterin-guanine dinucleotide biosynthesis protein B|nr:molybdopterin-guanine dinucleotide biosynthesis protein B [Clostridiales Family XIII bacterium]